MDLLMAPTEAMARAEHATDELARMQVGARGCIAWSKATCRHVDGHRRPRSTVRAWHRHRSVRRAPKSCLLGHLVCAGRAGPGGGGQGPSAIIWSTNAGRRFATRVVAWAEETQKLSRAYASNSSPSSNASPISQPRPTTGRRRPSEPKLRHEAETKDLNLGGGSPGLSSVMTGPIRSAARAKLPRAALCESGSTGRSSRQSCRHATSHVRLQSGHAEPAMRRPHCVTSRGPSRCGDLRHVDRLRAVVAILPHHHDAEPPSMSLARELRVTALQVAAQSWCARNSCSTSGGALRHRVRHDHSAQPHGDVATRRHWRRRWRTARHGGASRLGDRGSAHGGARCARTNGGRAGDTWR